MSEFKVGDRVVLDVVHNPMYGTVVDPTSVGTVGQLGASYKTCEMVLPDGGDTPRWWNRGRLTLTPQPTVELSEADRALILKAIDRNANDEDIVAARRLLTPTRTQTFTVSLTLPAEYVPATEELVVQSLAASLADDVHITATETTEKS